MSEMGAIMDKIVTAAEAAVTELVAEREIRLAKDTVGFPHAFIYAPEEDVGVFSGMQERVTTRILLKLITQGETQEDTALKLDSIGAQIRADKTLGGVVRWAYVSARGIAEAPSSNVKAGDMVIVTVQER